MDPQLLVEATVVGIGLVVVFVVVRMFVKNLYLALFVSGALFHLIAEFTGVNAWYLKNSVAAKKQ